MKTLIDYLKEIDLFQGLSQRQLEQLAPIINTVSYRAGEYLIHENTLSENIYIVHSGQIEVCKQDKDTHFLHCLATLGSKTVMGETGLLANTSSAVSVRAGEKGVSVYVIPIKALRSLPQRKPILIKLKERIRRIKNKKSHYEQSLQFILIENLAKNLVKHSHKTHVSLVEALSRELMHSKAREFMGLIFISVIFILYLYIFILELLQITNYKLGSSAFVTTPLIAISSAIVLFIFKKTGYPLSFFGLTLKKSSKVIREAILFTTPLLILVVLYKMLLIYEFPSFMERPLFEFGSQLRSLNIPWSIILLRGALYMLILIPLQEFLIRGTLQSILEELLVSRHKKLWSIVVSNLLFSITHLHFSFYAAIAIFIPGLYLGWLFARQRNLLGVIVAHEILGAWAIFAIGIRA